MQTTEVTGAASAPSGTRTAALAAKTGVGGDYETFLKMLTTQIRNQDPLNPMEGSDFAVQLATFSGVEQQVRTNDLLARMAGAGEGGLGGVANWIGKQVRTTGAVQFSGAPLRISVEPRPGADQVQLVTLDYAGREVQRAEIGPGAGDVAWSGLDAAGAALPPGLYRFRTESFGGGQPLGANEAGAYAAVEGAELGPDGIRLTLAGGASVLAADVRAIRSAP